MFFNIDNVMNYNQDYKEFYYKVQQRYSDHMEAFTGGNMMVVTQVNQDEMIRKAIEETLDEMFLFKDVEVSEPS